MAHEYTIRCVAPGDPYENHYLARYEPEAYDGRGLAEWTPTIDHAIRFPSHKAAMEAWMHVPITRPFRPDARPNRPLTAYTIAVEPIATEGI